MVITEPGANMKKRGKRQGLFETIFDAMPDPAILVDNQGIVLNTSTSFEKVFGFKKSEAMDKSLSGLEFLPEELKQHIRDNMGNRMRREEVLPYEIHLTTKEGVALYVELSTTLLEHQGELLTMFILHNITERKQTEQIFQTISLSSPIGIYVVQDGKFVFVNPRLLGDRSMTEDGLLGSEFTDMIHPEDRERVRQSAVEMLKGVRTTPYEYRLLTQDGAVSWVSETVASIQYQGRRAALGIVTDITERREVEELYQTLANSSPVGVYIVQDGRFQFVNPRFQEYTGYTGDELLGINSLDIVHPEDREMVRQNAVEMLKGERLSSYEFRYIRKSGETIWAMETTTPIHYKGERATLGNFIDITERKRADEALRESRKRFTDLVNFLPQTIFEHDKEGNLTFANRHAALTYGYTLENTTEGITTFGTVIPEDRDRVKENFQRVLNGEELGGVEYTGLRKDGSTFPVLTFAAPIIRDGQPVGLRGVTIDITEQKQMEQQLKQKVEELEAAYQKLQELDKLKDNFLSTVSHELRTPLTSIKSFSEILLSYDEDRETQREFLSIINEESERLTRLINNFLDLSKIEAGRMQWETAELPLPSAIQTAVNAIQALANQMNLRVDVDLEPDLPNVRYDRDRLVQVVTNLLSNAIKFSPEGGIIRVRAQIPRGSESAGDANMVLVGVSDSGRGIAPEDYESVFEKFKQVGDTLTDKPQGSGLGLPICREIVEHYGGRIWVESEPGKGSTFFFTVPSAKETGVEVAKAKGKPAEVVSKGVKTILVVDDEANISRFLEHELTKRGYQVLTASGGKEAIDMAREYHPNLITLDVLMPDIDGFDVTAILKNDPGVKDIPILIISVFEDREKAYKLGVNDYVTKPFEIDVLMDKVEGLLLNAQKEILVVDDDKALVKSLKYELDKRDYSTHVAYRGREALEMVEKYPPDLILLDIIMPGMDGYEVIKALKYRPSTAKIPIVLMTGVEIDGGRVKALSLGAAEYFTKSGGFDKMFKTIEGILSSKSDQ